MERNKTWMTANHNIKMYGTFLYISVLSSVELYIMLECIIYLIFFFTRRGSLGCMRVGEGAGEGVRGWG